MQVPFFSFLFVILLLFSMFSMQFILVQPHLALLETNYQVERESAVYILLASILTLQVTEEMLYSSIHFFPFRNWYIFKIIILLSSVCFLKVTRKEIRVRCLSGTDRDIIVKVKYAILHFQLIYKLTIQYGFLLHE